SRRRESTVPARRVARPLSCVRSIELLDTRLVVLFARPQGVRELVVAVRLVRLALFLEAAAERVVGIVVRRSAFEHRPALRLGLAPAVDAEVRDAEGLADGGLLRLAALRLLERDRRLRGSALPEVRLALLEEVVGLAHGVRYGKFSRIRSTGCVKSRVPATTT